ncbi:hypothetical protein HanXRQr2_Chr14g0646951 [Helianthus annuus]|uniref:Uncharacterized protein n=1 Tax=Helianthus annuus TaxID=4232 RepID=A0A251SIK0_HELAN|nr:hypothetical protein HanXRQr2_Chr14g0646951 [Helianthus annuus]KAJ0840607.1 hypothetical protein HanPSC8_Chr14g0620701 [Helianthus annuus]
MWTYGVKTHAIQKRVSVREMLLKPNSGVYSLLYNNERQRKTKEMCHQSFKM